MTANTIEAWMSERRDALAADMTRRHFERHPQLAERFGPAGRSKCEADARHHLDYLAVAAERASPQLFLDYIGWAKALLVSLKIGADDLRTTLECMQEALAESAPPAHREPLLTPVTSALARLDSLPSDLPTCIVPTRQHAGLAKRYLDTMLRGKRREAMQLIIDAAAEGIPVRELYLDVFTPVQHEIGRQWQLNEITVAEEHYCTAITQLVISQLYPYIFSADRKQRTLVGTCVAGDLHEIGVRMVADFFELDGWDTFYLGANVPISSVVDTISTRNADVLAVSATITRHVNHVAALIQAIRANEATRHVQVMVGGYPFNLDPDLWQRIGADGCARDAEGAVTLGNQLVDDSTS